LCLNELGAPGLDFQTWEIMILCRVHHPSRAFPAWVGEHELQTTLVTHISLDTGKQEHQLPTLRHVQMPVHTIRVQIPYHLRNLARVEGELTLEVAEPVTIQSVLDALEARYPMLSGTIREHDTLKRRPFLRYFACEEDLTHDPTDKPLPDAVLQGKEPFLIIGAIAGGF
jgi:hypothetical protein